MAVAMRDVQAARSRVAALEGELASVGSAAEQVAAEGASEAAAAEERAVSLEAELQQTRNRLDVVAHQTTLDTDQQSTEIAELQSALSLAAKAHTTELGRVRANAAAGMREAVEAGIG